MRRHAQRCIQSDRDRLRSALARHAPETSSSTPTVLERPEGFYDIQWVKYDIKTTSGGDQKYQDIPYVTPKEFMDRTVRRTLSDSIVEAQTLPDSGHITLIRNDKAPSYFTVLDGYDDLVFDAYDSNLETNLQSSKSLAYGNALPTLRATAKASRAV